MEQQVMAAEVQAAPSSGERVLLSGPARAPVSGPVSGASPGGGKDMGCFLLKGCLLHVVCVDLCGLDVIG